MIGIYGKKITFSNRKKAIFSHFEIKYFKDTLQLKHLRFKEKIIILVKNYRNLV